MSQLNPKYIKRVQPKLFIGLGGTGGKIVERIYTRLRQDEEWCKYVEPCTGFFVLDTNVEDLSRFSTYGSAIRTFHTARSDKSKIVASLIKKNDISDHIISEYF